MRDYARKAVDLMGDLNADAFSTDGRTFFAVVKCVETVGEAAARIGRSELDRIMPDEPWLDIIGMRNILNHEYTGVNAHTLHDTVTHALPGFAERVQELLEP